MTYDDFIRTIEHSEVEDWIYDAAHEAYVCKKDLLVTLQQGKAAPDETPPDWTQHYSGPAVRVDWNLCYNNLVVDRFETFWVDSMYIPLPEEDMHISDRQRRIGYIVNTVRRTDFLRYLDLARITVREAYTLPEGEAPAAYTS